MKRKYFEAFIEQKSKIDYANTVLDSLNESIFASKASNETKEDREHYDNFLNGVVELLIPIVKKAKQDFRADTTPEIIQLKEFLDLNADYYKSLAGESSSDSEGE
jgi:hypothetical protein